MQQANWISLGIIVTHFAWMVQRFVSSMRPTIYASAASCRHIIVCPWKCMSYLPTCMAISWTSHEKGSFWIRSSVLFWNCLILHGGQLSQASTFWAFSPGLPARIPSGGALPPTVGWSFLQAGSSQPDLDGPVSAAIWTNCWVGDDDGDCPTPSNCSAASTHLYLFSPGWSLLKLGWVVNGRGGPPSFLC